MDNDYNQYISELSDETGLSFDDALNLAEQLEDCVAGY